MCPHQISNNIQVLARNVWPALLFIYTIVVENVVQGGEDS